MNFAKPIVYVLHAVLLLMPPEFDAAAAAQELDNERNKLLWRATHADKLVQDLVSCGASPRAAQQCSNAPDDALSYCLVAALLCYVYPCFRAWRSRPTACA